jgi:serine phosphatase RsbU (regulator of sigma subunit)
MGIQSADRRNFGAPAPLAPCIDLAVERRTPEDDRLRGGDLVDVYETADGSACVLVADLSSKGPLGAKHAAILRVAFREAAPRERAPSYIMAALNRLHFDVETGGMGETFATAFVARVDRARRTLRYASAGHDTAVILRGRAHRHLVQTGPVIGVLPGAAYDDGFAEFAAGDLLLVATDGFTECRRFGTGAQLGTSGLMRALHARAGHTPASACAASGRFADEFTRGNYRDDATLVAIARH